VQAGFTPSPPRHPAPVSADAMVAINNPTPSIETVATIPIVLTLYAFEFMFLLLRDNRLF
jgi:hypothetical protein